ncbi:MAG TPA: energy transducer TonB, partial [Bryobacteraceae bacterium]
GLYRTSSGGPQTITSDDARMFARFFEQPGSVFLFVWGSGHNLSGRFFTTAEGRLTAARKAAFPFSRRELVEGTNGDSVASGVQKNGARLQAFPAVEERDASRLPGMDERPIIGKKAAWALGGAIAAGLVALGAIQYRALPAPETREATQKVAQDAAWLDLRAERIGAEWHLRWNREAVIVQSASNGHLQIVDGDYHKDLALDANDLRNGSLVYAPMTDEVSFRLEVFDTAHQRTLAESVRAAAGVLPGAAARRPQTSDESSATRDGLFSAIRELMRAQNPAAESAPASRDTADQDVATNKEKSFGSRPAMKVPPLLTKQAFTPPPASDEVIATKQGVESVPLPAPPALTERNATGGLPAEPALVMGGAPPAPPAPTAPKPQGVPTPQRVPTSQGATTAAIVRTVPPVYPPAARATRVSGVVEVLSTVDVNGRTKDVRAESGPELLRGAAVEAVRHYVYKPAMLNGQPVESQARVQLRFSMDQ